MKSINCPRESFDRSSTISDTAWAAAEDFTNQFPSDNDMSAYAEFVHDAVENGADPEAWLSRFRAYIVGADDVNREFENFTLDSSGDRVTSPDVEEFDVIPEPDSDEYERIQNSANRAATDANNGCG